MEWIVPIAALLFVGLWVVAIMDAARSRHCPYCIRKIHRDATRCPWCTSDVGPKASAPPGRPTP